MRKETTYLCLLQTQNLSTSTAFKIQSTLFIQILNTIKFIIMVNYLHKTVAQGVTVNQKLCKKIVFNTTRYICFEFLLGDSNKYPKYTFYEEIKEALSYMHSAVFKDSYNSKLILMATSLGSNDVVEMRVHCKRVIPSICILLVYTYLCIQTYRPEPS